MVRSRLRGGLIAVASAGLIASSLWTLPAGATPSPEPTASPTPSTSEVPTASPTPEPSVSADPDTSTPTPAPSGQTESSPAADEPSDMPSGSPSPSPSGDETLADEGSVREKIIQLADGADQAAIADEITAVGGEIFETYTDAVTGFAARLSAKDAFYLAELGGIASIEDNLEITLQSTAIRTDNFCTTNSLGKTDDGSTLGIDIGFDVNWFGITYDQVLINNNGGISFNDGAGRFEYWNGINLTTVDRPLVLPLFTDIDTRNAASSPVTYGTGTVDGRNAFCINWVNVGEYNQTSPKFSFQLVIIDRSTAGNGHVDLEFNYNEVGLPTSGSNGRFVVGYAVPHSRTDSLVRASSSDSPALYADGGALALTSNKYPSSESTNGRYTFEIRPSSSGSPPPSDPTPTPIGTAGNCNGLTNPSSTLAGYLSTYCGVVWGLDRSDQRSLPLNSEYSPGGNGTGVLAYVVDTGLNESHQDFTGRVVAGRNFFTSDQASSNTDDCNGHGTHVASTLAGSTYGMAKDAAIVPVRVFGCSGGTTTSIIISALDWIAQNHPAGTPGVVNMSLGGGPQSALDAAVQCLTGVGSGCSNNKLTVVVAAGNANIPAADVSPARVEEAITVGATASTDQRASFSNYGSAVDIFAPGVGIRAAWIGSTTANVSISGTSMASPHVAGAAAVYLGNNPSATPAQVMSALVADATDGAVSNPGLGSPNKLLYIGGLASVTAVSPNTDSTSGGAPVTITGENLDNPSGSTTVEFGSGRSATVASEADGALTVTAPSASAGAVNLIIDNGRGKQTITNAFTYTVSSGTAPNISAISPSAGATAGGSTITISGTNLQVGSESTSVLFGSTPGVVTATSATQITVRTPAQSAGISTVSVITSEGVDTAAFTYVAAPNVASVTPESGPIAGGTDVTINGANLSLVSSVTVGGAPAAFTLVNGSSLRFTTPPRPSATANSYDLVITSPGGSITVRDSFTYMAAPSIASIASVGQLSTATTTLSGPAAGGTGVRILGANLNDVTSVRFGSNAATFTRESGASILAISPAGTGLVDLTVTSPGGSDTLANAFEYEAAPVVGGVGGVGAAPPAAGGGGGGGDDEITPTRPANTANQVDQPGAFRIVDDRGRSVRLNRAELSSTGLIVAGDSWGLQGSGPLTAQRTTVDPGSAFSFTGNGLKRLTTVGVYILSNPTWVASGIVGYDGNFRTAFQMPALPPGQHTLQINAVLPDDTPISIGVGFVLSGSTTPVKQALAAASQSNPAADFALFRGTSTNLTKATRNKLTRIAKRYPDTSAGATIVAFTNSSGTPASTRRAQARAEKMQAFMQTAGFPGPIQIVTEPGSTKLQSRGALVYVQPAGTSAASVDEDSVRSLIVRLKKGRSITTDGQVRGSNNVTGPIGDSLTVGPYLGLRMYRVDFAEPVSVAVAERVAKELARDRGIEFAEPDSIVSTQVSIAS